MTTTTATGAAGQGQIYLIAAAVLTIAAGGFALMQLMTEGHAAFNTTSTGLMWGLPIVTYDYFLLTSTGLVMVAALGLVFGMDDFRLIARRCLWLAFAGLVGGVAVLFLELGYPLRALLLGPTSFQTASPLFWKMLLVGLYTIVLLVTLLTGDEKLRRGEGSALTTLLFILAVLISLVAGSVYGMMAMRPFWFGGEIPVAFLIESFLGGLAFAVFFTYLAHGFSAGAMPAQLRVLLGGRLAMLLAIVIALHLAFIGGRAITGLWSNASGMQVWQHLVSQPLFHIGLWVCTVLPLIILLTGARSQPAMQLLAAVLVMIGLFISRYEFIIGGQIVPLFKGSWAPSLISYVPSMTEWALLALGIGIANLIYAAAIQFRGAED
ncbi:MAG: NrfD/PsrC family molybdoenzyme membrane anchor subunit [Hyphomicrobiaceae bacterium]